LIILVILQKIFSPDGPEMKLLLRTGSLLSCMWVPVNLPVTLHT